MSIIADLYDNQIWVMGLYYTKTNDCSMHTDSRDKEGGARRKGKRDGTEDRVRGNGLRGQRKDLKGKGRQISLARAISSQKSVGEGVKQRK